MSLSFPVAPSVGQVYQGWTWNGQAWDPNYAASFVTSIMGKSGALQQADVVGPGNRVQLAQSIVSSAVSQVVQFYTFTNAYDEYEWDIYDLRPDTNAAQFAFRLSTDGSTFDSTSNYTYAISYATSQPSGGYAGAASQIYVPLGPQLYLSAQSQSHMKMRFTMPWTADRMKFFNTEGAWSGTTQLNYCGVAGGYSGLAALRGFQFFCTPGNIARGVFNLYGIKGAGGT